jgi:hypothetical protein
MLCTGTMAEMAKHMETRLLLQPCKRYQCDKVELTLCALLLLCFSGQLVRAIAASIPYGHVQPQLGSTLGEEHGYMAIAIVPCAWRCDGHLHIQGSS